MFSFLRHLFIPHHSNNHRSKLLHHDSLLIIALLFIVLSSIFVAIRKTAPGVLGVATNINVTDLLNITNQKRQEQGLASLRLDGQLTEAAKEKGDNMFAQNYWAHNGPDGTTPWVFFQRVGYNYIYAGENLAKDFNDSQGVVDAWMNSPSHRENMLNNHYDDVGFAVINGSLLGEQTTLVVEEFGRRAAAAPSVPKAAAAAPTPTSIPTTPITQLLVEISPTVAPPTPTAQDTPTPLPLPTTTIGFRNPSADDNTNTSLVAGIRTAPFLDSSSLSKRIAIITLAIIIAAFILDMIYIERRKLIRLVGHNSDHILFLIGAIILILIIGGGIIL